MLVEWMDAHPEVGISSCQLVDALGQPLTLPGELPRLGDEILWLLRLDLLRKKSSGNRELAAERVKGAFMLVRKELVEKLGFAFDPRYFLLL